MLLPFYIRNVQLYNFLILVKLRIYSLAFYHAIDDQYHSAMLAYTNGCKHAFLFKI